MADHFTLDIDPETIRGVKRRLKTLADHLRVKGSHVASQPDEIGEQWTGGAAETIKGEMTGLGALMKGFAGNADAIAEGAHSLAKDYQDALDQLPDLNRRWNQAQSDYASAITKADNSHADGVDAATADGKHLDQADRGELDRIRSGAKQDAADARQETQHNLELSFGYTKQWLAQQTRAFSDVLVDQTPVDVPPSALEDLAGGKLPQHPFDHTALLDGLALAQQYENNALEDIRQSARDDVDALQDQIDDPDTNDSSELRELLAGLDGKAEDPVYAQAFAEAGGADLVNDLYDLGQYYLTTGETSEDDWVASMAAFNDVMAAGLAEMSDTDVADFSTHFANPENGPRLGAITGSDYADDRLAGLALSLSWYMRYDIPVDRDGAVDLGRAVQDAAYDGSYEEMVQSWSDRTDPDRLAQVLNNASADDRDLLLRELADLHAYDNRTTIDPDTYRIRTNMLEQLLHSSRDANFPNTLESTLQTIKDAEDDLELSQTDIDLTGFFQDEDTLDYLIEHRTEIDQELISEMFGDYMSDTDVEEMLEGMIARNGDRGVIDQTTARNAGYLLGLAESAGVDIDVSKALQPIVDQALSSLIDAAGDAAPGINVAKSILENFQQQYADAAEKRADFGDEYSEEQLHENLAWIIYLQNHGAPDSYQTWLNDAEAQNSVSSSDPLSAATQYLAWLNDPDNDDQATGEEIRALEDLINNSRFD